MNPDVHTLTQRLDHVFSLSDRVISDDEVVAQYARYLCVLVSGYVEESVRILILEYSTQHARPNIVRFVQQNSQNLTNLKATKLRQVLDQFSVGWAEALDARMKDEEKDALDSVVANRHSIAHGKSTGISLGRVKGYYELIKPLVKSLDQDIIQ